MPSSPRQTFQPDLINGYHAHVYYANADERALAAVIREAAETSFDVVMGRWRDEPVGPHPLPMYQIAFASDVMPKFLSWLQSVRGQLSILVHVRTGVNDLTDHTAGAMWLGRSLELNLGFFDRDSKRA
jgi:DOPA 4,5-dioxygenase